MGAGPFGLVFQERTVPGLGPGPFGRFEHGRFLEFGQGGTTAAGHRNAVDETKMGRSQRPAVQGDR
jgi:hypothetical protein